MATRRQIKANRANAKFCTGPKTEAGKQIVSQNAITHGLFSKAVVLRAESSQAFEDLLASMVTKFNPQDATDHALIETMAIATWRLARIATLMTATFEIQMALQDPASGNAPIRAAYAVAGCRDTLNDLYRYQAADKRLYSRALADFQQIQATRSAENPLASEPRQHLSLALGGTWAPEEIENNGCESKTNSPEKPLEQNDSKSENTQLN